MSENFLCWKCGETLTGVILPLSRREECAACSADQHVCKMCVFFDNKSRGSCNEERAEMPSDLERANFCDYFKPSTCAFNSSGSDKSAAAKAKFAALFGDDDDTAASAESSTEPTLEAKEAKEAKKLSPAEIAEQKLRDLLGG